MRVISDIFQVQLINQVEIFSSFTELLSSEIGKSTEEKGNYGRQPSRHQETIRSRRPFWT